MLPDPQSMRQQRTRTWRERFVAGYLWLVLKNVLGWTLILLSLVVGPLVPGPGGIPLFLIGFALVSFPGKRKLTARVLRGRRIRLSRRSLLLVIGGVSLVIPALAQWLLSAHPNWLEWWQGRGLFVTYVGGVVVILGAMGGAVLSANLLLRIMPPIRRKVRPWLRRHRIRLLPPRRRRRHPHEHGTGPVRLRDEILSFLKRHPHPATKTP